ncbi:hypothetical protein ECDEC10F_1963 [Escherichia coli DEC10F]|nr:hypothetical protein ECDEC10F_1963 [Escherichia coli DEC10F]
MLEHGVRRQLQWQWLQRLGTFFLYCLFVRNGGANKDFTHFVLTSLQISG